jgi:hypothetical protein
MVTEFGMSDKLGPLTFGKRSDHMFMGREMGTERDYGEKIASMIDDEVKRIVTEQYENVKSQLVKYRPHMDEIVKVLLEKETLERKEVDDIIAEVNNRLGWSQRMPRSVDFDDKASPPPADTVLDGGKITMSSTPKQDDPPSGLQPSFA